MAGGKIKMLAPGTLSDDRQFVSSGGAKAGPGANGGHARQLRQVLAGAGQHAGDDVVVHGRVFHTKLAGGADEQLPGEARLHVEGEGLGGENVRALQVAEFHQLVADETGIAVRDDELAFARAHFQAGRKLGRPGAGGINDRSGVEAAAVLKDKAVVAHLDHFIQIEVTGTSLGLAQQEAGGTGSVDDQVFRNEQGADQSGTEVRLGLVQGVRVKDLDGDGARAIVLLLAAYFLHFLIVGGNPDGATGHIFDVGRQFGGEFAPELLGVAGKGKLRFGIVHDDDVAHAGGGSAAQAGLNHGNAQACAGKFAGASGADDAGADDGHVVIRRGRAHVSPPDPGRVLPRIMCRPFGARLFAALFPRTSVLGITVAPRKGLQRHTVSRLALPFASARSRSLGTRERSVHCCLVTSCLTLPVAAGALTSTAGAAPGSGMTPCSSRARLKAGTLLSIRAAYSTFTPARSFSMSWSRAYSVSVGGKSVPPATSPAPGPISAFSQSRL